jgi:hypothetical protein
MMWPAVGHLAATFVLMVSMLQPAFAFYITEGTSIQGVGYRTDETVAFTAKGTEGQRLFEKTAGTGRFDGSSKFEMSIFNNSINYSRESTVDYFPVSYRSGSIDYKWLDQVAVANHDLGGAISEMWYNTENLEKSTAIKSISNSTNNTLEANIWASGVGMARIGWVSWQPGLLRPFQLGGSSDEIAGAFTVTKEIRLGNSSMSQSRIDWMPWI